MEDISDSAKRNPSNLLIIGRTIMANDRTILAFFRTSLAFCAAGIGLIKYLDHPAYDVLGLIFIGLAGIFSIWGVHRYMHVKKILKAVTPDDEQEAEREMGL
jgi:putative membrane protein